MKVGDRVSALAHFNRVVGILESIEGDFGVINGRDLFGPGRFRFPLWAIEGAN